MVKRLQWHEPAAYRRGLHLEQEAENPWGSVKRVSICAVLMLVLRGFVELGHWHNGQFPNRPSWPISIALAAILGVAVGYLLPRILLFLPGSIVILSEKGVNNNVLLGEAVAVKFLPWDKIDHARIWRQSVRGREFAVLSLIDSNGAELATYALRDRPGIAEIEAYFRQHGKSCEHLS